MDETAHGTRDRRGHYVPKDPIESAPIYEMPPHPKRVLSWLVGHDGYLFPWNAALFAIAAGIWVLLTPPMETMATLSPGWILYLLARNAVLITLFFGAFHLRLYMKQKQGTAFKYNPKFPEKAGQRGFLFGSQTRENVFWTLCSGVPIWTAYEVLMLWLFASGKLPWLSFADSPVWFILFMALIPIWREFHFYCIHRLIHWGPFYRWIHKLHHNNVNPGPWSSLSMHPVEHALYFSVVLIHVILPSHPLHALFSLHHAAFGSLIGHIGFDKVVTGDRAAMDTHAYSHYLHHKFFEVNYGDGLVPLDRVFGTFHDGTPEGDRAMDARRRRRMQSQRQAG
ncbi:sterol desaturase family protein [Mangrovicoccus sp. HB161399]|uniref:sterol desaturase family protein n=1 Tax=Mangrovicoccus sp. HB161399 TaxID=2720392 RepID=UPI0015538313|nr:sterol desaturase family protein [Mangrovicoccus sp. HB161399]